MEPSTGESPEAIFHSEERRTLLGQLKLALGSEVSPTAWALLWLSDVDQLRQLVQRVDEPVYVAALLTYSDLGFLVRRWCQRYRAPSGTSTPRGSRPATPKKRTHTGEEVSPATTERESAPSTPTRPKRDPNADAKCRQRDSNQCIITRYVDLIDACHIYPLAMANETRTGGQPFSFWSILEMFWSKAAVDAWYDAVFPRGTEVVQNRICLAPHVHRWHSAGVFALRPIGVSEDRKTLTVKFYWLADRPSSRGNTVDILEFPALLPEDPAHRPKNFRVWNAETQQQIKSGDDIILTTHDPDTHPLPDMRLLEMQWNLQQLVALSGAAEPKDDIERDGDDDTLGAVSSWEEYDYLDEEAAFNYRGAPPDAEELRRAMIRAH